MLDLRKLKSLEGRVLAHGEEEAGKAAGRHYLLLEGSDAKVHLIYYTPEMEEARSRGKLRTNSFVRLQKQFENGRPVLEAEDLGDAERLVRNRRHLVDRAMELRSDGLVTVGHAWGGWLGRYYAALTKTAIELTTFESARRAERDR